jgi:hypothetical protein
VRRVKAPSRVGRVPVNCRLLKSSEVISEPVGVTPHDNGSIGGPISVQVILPGGDCAQSVLSVAHSVILPCNDVSDCPRTEEDCDKLALLLALLEALLDSEDEADIDADCDELPLPLADDDAITPALMDVDVDGDDDAEDERDTDVESDKDDDTDDDNERDKLVLLLLLTEDDALLLVLMLDDALTESEYDKEVERDEDSDDETDEDADDESEAERDAHSCRVSQLGIINACCVSDDTSQLLNVNDPTGKSPVTQLLSIG